MAKFKYYLILAVIFVCIVLMVLGPKAEVKHKAGVIKEAGERQAQKVTQIVYDYVVDTLWKKADKCFHDGKYEEDVRVCKVIVRLDPSFVEAYSVGGWILESLGREDEGLEFYKQGLAANPKHYKMYFELGMFYFNCKNYKEAVKYLAEAVKFECPDFVRRPLAHAYERSGELGKALETWKGLLEIRPGDGVALRKVKELSERLEKK